MSKKILKELKKMLKKEIGEDSNKTQFYIKRQLDDTVEICCIGSTNVLTFSDNKEAYAFIPPRIWKEPEEADILCCEKIEELLECQKVTDANRRFLAKENLAYTKRMANELEIRFVNLGLALRLNKEHKYWRELGFSSFRSYLSFAVSSQSQAYRAMEIAETFCLIYNIPIERLGSIGAKKLHMLVPVAKNCTAEELDKWLAKAEIFSAEQLRSMVDARHEETKYVRPPTKPEIINEIRKLIIARKIDLPMNDLRAVEQIGKLTGYNHTEIKKLIKIRNQYAFLQQKFISGDDAREALQEIEELIEAKRKLPRHRRLRGMFIECTDSWHYVVFDSRDGLLIKHEYLLGIEGIIEMSAFLYRDRRIKP